MFICFSFSVPKKTFDCVFFVVCCRHFTYVFKGVNLLKFRIVFTHINGKINFRSPLIKFIVIKFVFFIFCRKNPKFLRVFALLLLKFQKQVFVCFPCMEYLISFFVGFWEFRFDHRREIFHNVSACSCFCQFLFKFTFDDRFFREVPCGV